MSFWSTFSLFISVYELYNIMTFIKTFSYMQSLIIFTHTITQLISSFSVTEA